MMRCHIPLTILSSSHSRLIFYNLLLSRQLPSLAPTIGDAPSAQNGVEARPDQNTHTQTSPPARPPHEDIAVQDYNNQYENNNG